MISEPGVPKSLEDAAKTAAVRRTELAQSYLTGQAAQLLLGIDADTLTTWRENKQLLGVWHDPIKAWLYPDFQFNGKELVKQMPVLLAAYDRYYNHVWENTWSIVEWFLTPHTLLNGSRPMDILTTSPERVLKVAQTEFGEDPSTLW